MTTGKGKSSDGIGIYSHSACAATTTPVAVLTGPTTPFAHVGIAAALLDRFEAKPPYQSNYTTENDQHNDHKREHCHWIDGDCAWTLVVVVFPLNNHSSIKTEMGLCA